MIDTAGTITNGAQALIDRGASKVYACCTHGVLSGPAIERIKNSCIEQLVMLDTITLSDEKENRQNQKHFRLLPFFGEAIDKVYEETSISTLFI
ncbi:MAG: hypothetical protein L6V93_11750 [Clostridiales bacterium]|nr:MAG: hypothetical protein L6V93_11750 [Clostridiales bacterium]